MPANQTLPLAKRTESKPAGIVLTTLAKTKNRHALTNASLRNQFAEPHDQCCTRSHCENDQEHVSSVELDQQRLTGLHTERRSIVVQAQP